MARESDRNVVRTSRFLSHVLRHHPESIGLALDGGGWVPVERLLAAAREHGRDITREKLELVVAENDKQRFSFSPDGDRVRANQGHSVEVDLDLEPVEPPELLYHGTVDRFLDSIRNEGLTRRSRHHVHLSGDAETAARVGARRGRPLVLVVEAGRMRREARSFFRSANGVWLTDSVPPEFIRFPGDAAPNPGDAGEPA